LWDFLDFFVKGVLNSKDEDYSFFAGRPLADEDVV
jgi:hypothetical protein